MVHTISKHFAIQQHREADLINFSLDVPGLAEKRPSVLIGEKFRDENVLIANVDP